MSSKKTRNDRSTSPSRRNSSETLRELARMARATVKDEKTFRKAMQIVVDAGCEAGPIAPDIAVSEDDEDELSGNCTKAAGCNVSSRKREDDEDELSGNCTRLPGNLVQLPFPAQTSRRGRKAREAFGPDSIFIDPVRSSQN